jgi:hypothetical protein
MYIHTCGLLLYYVSPPSFKTLWIFINVKQQCYNKSINLLCYILYIFFEELKSIEVLRLRVVRLAYFQGNSAQYGYGTRVSYRTY